MLWLVMGGGGGAPSVYIGLGVELEGTPRNFLVGDMHGV